MEIQKWKDISRRSRPDGMGMGPWQAKRMRLRGKKRLKQSERSEPVTSGLRLEQAGAETCQESWRRSETASKSQSDPQDPGARLKSKAELCTQKG